MSDKDSRDDAVFIVVGAVIGFVAYYLTSSSRAVNQQNTDFLVFVILAIFSGVVGTGTRSWGTGFCILIPGLIAYVGIAPRIAEVLSH